MSEQPVFSSPGKGKLSSDDLITLNEEIAGMAKAGLPLDQGLSSLAREMGRGRLRNVTLRLAKDLRAGLTLPQAFDRQKGRIPSFYPALLTAGIRSGRIGEVLGTLTLYARSMADFRETVFSALFYPAVVLMLGIGLLLFVSFAILPNFVDLFEKMHMNLPLLTRGLVFLGTHPMEILVIPMVVVVLGMACARWGLRAMPGGRVLWARFVYAMPLVGTLIRSARLAAFADLLGILVDQSVPLPQGFPLAAEASSDPLLSEGAKRIENDLGQGLPLGASLKRQAMVPELVAWMVGFGEKQGTLGPALHQVAELYRRQTEVRATLLRTILPSLLIIFLAGTLGGVFIFGLLGPMFGLLEGLGGFKLGGFKL
jgi:type II secretory pathway component PulF